MEFYEKRDNRDDVTLEQCVDKSEIQEFYRNKTIFITGASGFVGTLVLEKLLRSCPDIKRIYILFRSTKRKHITQRLKEYFNEHVFDVMKTENPNYFTKVTCVEGDLSLDNLGLSPADTQAIVENTQVVMHVAATVKFDEYLRDAYNINVKGSKSLILLAEQMQHLRSFVYVSTAYSNCDRSFIEEKFYEPPFTDDQTVSILQHSNLYEQILLTPFIQEKKPNTYIFTKAISEDLIHRSSGHLPVTVVRPSVVMPTFREPFSYWTMKNNAIMSLMAASGVGLVRVFYHDGKKLVNLIPGDLTANCIIAAGWQKATVPESPLIYNCVASENAISLHDLTTVTSQYHQNAKESVRTVVWKSHVIGVQNTYVMFFLYYVLHVLPGLFFSLVERYLNKKPMVMKIYRKTFFLTKTIHYFSFNEWSFTNENTRSLLNSLNAKDRQLFDFDMGSVCWYNFVHVFYRCISKYFMEDYDSYPKELYKKKMVYIDVIDDMIVWGFRIGVAYLALSIISVGLNIMIG